MHSFSGLKSVPSRFFHFHENSRFWFKCKYFSQPQQGTSQSYTRLRAASFGCARGLRSLPCPISPVLFPVAFPSHFVPRTFALSQRSHLPSRTGAPAAVPGSDVSPCSPGVSKPALSHIRQSNVNPFKSYFNYRYFGSIFFNLFFIFSPFPTLPYHLNSLLQIVLINLSWHLCTFILTSNWGVHKTGLE